MEVIRHGGIDSNTEQMVAQENERIMVAFEFCETIDEVRLRYLDDIEQDKDTGDDYIRLQWGDGKDRLEARVDWHDLANSSAASSTQVLRSVLLESIEGGESVNVHRYEFMDNGTVTFLDESSGSGSAPATFEDVAGLRTLLLEDDQIDQAA